MPKNLQRLGATCVMLLISACQPPPDVPKAQSQTKSAGPQESSHASETATRFCEVKLNQSTVHSNPVAYEALIRKKCHIGDIISGVSGNGWYGNNYDYFESMPNVARLCDITKPTVVGNVESFVCYLAPPRETY